MEWSYTLLPSSASFRNSIAGENKFKKAAIVGTRSKKLILI